MLGEINRDPSPAVLRQFGFVMLAGFGAFGGLVWIKASPEGLSWAGTAGQFAALALWGVGLGVMILTLVAPAMARPIYAGWMSVAMALGAVMTPVMLTVLFVVVLPVFALIRFKDPLRLKLRRSGSYWEPHKPHEPTVERCARPF